MDDNVIILNNTALNISNISMDNSNYTSTNNSQNNIGDIIQISLLVLIIIHTSIYIILVLSRKTLRSK